MVKQNGITGNDYVKCKLTDAGLEILRKQHNELRAIAPQLPPWTPPKLDNEGFYEAQLWCLMDDFGRNSLGGFLPFTDFIVPQHEAEFQALAERCERLDKALRGVIAEADRDTAPFIAARQLLSQVTNV